MELDVREFEFIHDRLLLQELPTEDAPERTILKPSDYDEKPRFGIVVKVGNEVEHIKEGDTILFNEYSTTRFRYEGNDYYSVREEDVEAYKRA